MNPIETYCYAAGIEVCRISSVAFGPRRYSFRCRQGHVWTGDDCIAISGALAMDSRRLRDELRHLLTCTACEAADRAKAMLMFEDPDYLRVEGAAE